MSIVKAAPVTAKKPVKGEASQKAQRTKAEGAQGEALAETLLNALTEQAAVEEGHKSRLQLFVKDLAKLTHEGHLWFRARLDAELATVRALKKAAGETKAGERALAEDTILGAYGFASLPVRVSQWVAISKALDIGVKLDTSVGFNRIVSEAVAFNRAHASNAGQTPAPTVRKGRPSGAKETFADKASKFIKGLDKTDLTMLIALAQKALKNAPDAAPM